MRLMAQQTGVQEKGFSRKCGTKKHICFYLDRVSLMVLVHWCAAFGAA